MQAKDFVKALSLRERHEVLMQAAESGKLSRESNVDAWERWTSRRSSLSEEAFGEIYRLRKMAPEIASLAMSDELDNEISSLLSESVEESDWFNKLRQLLDEFEEQEYSSELKYSYIFAPFLVAYADLITERVSQHSFLGKGVLESLLGALAQELTNACLKSIVLVVRESEDLSEEGSEEELDAILSELGTNEKRLSLFCRFPVLARRMVNIYDRFYRYSSKIIDDLEADYDQVVETLSLGSFEVVALNFGEGDTHRGGMTVVELLLREGQNLFYKPHNLETAQLYHRVVEILNQHDSFLDLRTAQSVGIGDHTYELKVSHNSCTSQEEAARAFVRYGQLLGVSYLLNISDLHLENIVVDGEHPVIIDVETVLANYASFKFEGLPDAMRRDLAGLADSVTGSIILPSPLTVGSDGKSVDLGALSAGEQKISNVLTLRDANKSSVRFENAVGTMPAASNLIQIGDEVAHYEDYRNEFTEGFLACVRLVQSEAVAAQVSELVQNIGGRVRSIIRPTSNYARMYEFTRHPKCMADALEVDKILENLFAMPFAHPQVIVSEYDDMEAGDIPYFTTDPHSKDLTDSGERLHINFFDHSAVERVEVKIAGLSDERIAQQHTLIQLKIGGTPEPMLTMDRARQQGSAQQDLNAALLSEAKSIADKVLSAATFGNDGTISWLRVEEDHPGLLLPVDVDLYSGISGAMYLFHLLGHETEDEHYIDARDRCFKSLQKLYLNPGRGTSAYMGAVSAIHPLLKMAQREGGGRQVPSLIRSLYKQLKLSVQEGPFADQTWLTGAASLVSLLVNYHDYAGDSEVLMLAERVADGLLKNLNSLNQKDLFGVAHGYAGVAIAIHRLGKSTGSARYLDEAQRLLQLTSDQPGPNTPLSWCRGTVGRALALAYCEQPETAQRLIGPLDGVGEDKHLMDSDCLCHGNAGRIDALLELHRLGGGGGTEAARSLAANMLDRRDERGEYAVEGYPGFPGVSMFTSDLGIAYSFLRVINPSIGSILVLR